ncbi:MAG: acetate/propionate family kinase, partial [Woeseiaceae bacterium]
MLQHVLVLNAGSSSLKFGMYQLPEQGSLALVAQGQVEGIGTQPRFSARDETGATLADQELSADVSDAISALDQLAQWLASRFDRESLVAVGHRVVHGGDKHSRPTLVTPEIVRDLEVLSPLAPLHQPFNLAAINAVFDRLPGLPQVACFDTAFHRGHSAVAEVIPLPREIRDGGLQRYGFHG